MVVNCIAQPGEPIKAVVYKSDFVYDTITDYERPDGTQVFLYVNGESKGEMRLDSDTSYYAHYLHPVVNWFFTSDYIPQIGDVIKIKVTASGFDDVEGGSEPLPNEPIARIAEVRMTECDSNMSSGHHYPIPDTDSTYTVWYTNYRQHLTVTMEITDPIISTSTAELEDLFGLNIGLSNRSKVSFPVW
ncbi:MAG: DUF4249 family protein [Bacteroidales bacterium]|nr:DUF4249 family protein [Bacteroidales bacterium]